MMTRKAQLLIFKSIFPIYAPTTIVLTSYGKPNVSLFRQDGNSGHYPFPLWLSQSRTYRGIRKLMLCVTALSDPRE